ncbi:MAG: TonB-dependent receptor [Prevotellaceae bacterium]|jgi:iron complex outermembrane receptor protein|nr:TonB-dependent receptor [Prevotellaceae bacterium]
MRTRRKTKTLQYAFLLILCMFAVLSASAQNKRLVTGTVIDEKNQPATGASIVEKGTFNGTSADVDGKFQLSVSDNAVLEVIYLGYITQEIPIENNSVFTIALQLDAQQLSASVVIGYGSVKKGDLTGSVAAIGAKDFQKGVVTNPGSLITGKIAGVQITSNGGRAGDGNRIRIRGGASLNASNDPLIVVDGMPLDNGGISGMTNPLGTFNSNDIESMNILKDASAAAIYGSRASNGVIIITTKKGSKAQKLGIDISSQNSVSTVARRVEVMNSDEFYRIVTSKAYNDVNTEKLKYINYLGTANTDWQDEIFRTAFTSDNNISISGYMKNLPYRVSAGFITQDGILKTDNMQRTTTSINLSPSFFDNYLNININAKGVYSHSRFGNGDAIGAALRMDPTQPVKADGFDNLNGYWTWMDGDTGNPNSLATKNPVALLYAKDDQSDVVRGTGNVQFDYKMHFLPDLRANLNLGYDFSQGKGKVIIQPWSPSNYQTGYRSQYKQQKENKLFEFYLNYARQLNVNHRVEVMAGYTYQDWKVTNHNYQDTYFDGTPATAEPPSFPKSIDQNTLVSFFGRLNYNLMDKYLLTATIRQDGSSRFAKANRWGTFPSVAFAWRINKETFLENAKALSNLKLRLGYGVTGQQEGIGNYDHIARYQYSESTARIQFGNQFYYLWRPAGYDPDRKWEQTTTANVALDFGFINNRIFGSVDFYYKHTIDLLNDIPVPLGSNFTNRIVKNIGNMDNRGVEFNINAYAIDKNDLRWELGFNITYNKRKITKLSLNDDPTSDYKGVPTGDISGGTSNRIQIHSVGYAPNTFYVYKQLYDSNGKPIEGAYADLNGDGITNSSDLYHYKTSDPDVYMGFSTSFTFKKWTLSTALRTSLGNYVYNNIYSDAGNYALVLNSVNYLQNTVKDIKNTNFDTQQLLSDYYIQNASFLKMDYISLVYDFGKIFNAANLQVNFTVQNVFTITKYDGIDPEIANGIDNNFYPNPRTFGLGLRLNF